MNNVGQQTVATELADVIYALRSNIMRNLKVATLGIVRKDNGLTCLVEPFPIVDGETKKTIECAKSRGLALSNNDVVLVVFTDRNFIQNLQQVSRNIALTPLQNDAELHLQKYGVVVTKISLTEEE